MGYLDDYRKRVATYASSPVNSMVRNYEKFINDQFSNSPSYRTGTLNGNEIDFLLVSGTNNKNQYGEKEFLLRPNTIVERGDYFESSDDTWIVIDKNYENQINPKATVYLCNEELKWKNANGTIVTYPCATIPYRAIRNIQVDTNNLNMPEGHMFLMVRMNPDTSSVVEKQRFILGNQVYEITGIDDSNYAYKGKGLLYFTVGLTTKNTSNDDFVSRIADNSFIYNSQTPSNIATTGNSSSTTPPITGGGKLWR